MATKLWDKGFEPDKMIEEYTVGDDRELDMRLAKYDVEGSLAHIAMLEKIGLLTSAELEELTAGLKEIAAEIEAGRFAIEPDTEDVHSQVELMLTRRLGDAGKKIHSGRSRNDQVLVDLKLFLRDANTLVGTNCRSFCCTITCYQDITVCRNCYSPRRSKGRFINRAISISAFAGTSYYNRCIPAILNIFNNLVGSDISNVEISCTFIYIHATGISITSNYYSAMTTWRTTVIIQIFKKNISICSHTVKTIACLINSQTDSYLPP